MMASSFHFLLVLSCVTLIHLAKQDDGCVPGTVTNLRLSGDVLTWDTRLNEKCSISLYHIDITSSNGTIIYSYTVEFPVVTTDHLPRCEGYTFTVFQISTDNLIGPGGELYVMTAPDSDSNLALDYIRITQEDKNLRLQWSLDDEYIRCARHYRIVVYNEDNDESEDIYTASTSVFLNNIVPCAHYAFSVRAVFSLAEEGPITVLRYTAASHVTSAPQPASFTTTNTSISIIWNLEAYRRNRCPISSLIIDGSPYFNVIYTVLDQVNRTLPLRLTGLSPDTMYYLRVVANNTAGPSEPFKFAVQTRSSN